MQADRRGFMKFLSGGVATAGITNQMLQAEIEQRPAITEEFLRQAHNEDQGKAFNYAASSFDMVSWAIYDRMEIPATTPFDGFDVNSLAPFSNPLSNGRWRGLADTNMYQPRRLSMPSIMRIERIFFIFDPENADTDMTTFRRNVSWYFYKGVKSYAQSTMMESATRVRFSDVIGDKGYPTGLVPVDTLVLRPDLSIFIGHYDTFHMEFQSSARLIFRKTFSFHVFLDGIMARAIQ